MFNDLSDYIITKVNNYFGLFNKTDFPLLHRDSFGPASSSSTKPCPQAVREDHPGPDGAEREAAPHPADLLQRQPATGRSDEGAAGGDDRPEPKGDPRLVSEQALQRQEEIHHDEAAPTAATQRQNREFGIFKL